ncbi:abasic site processing protein HMCES [Chanos chanos]|uniref:Abasic site processing protein HMCES n=1 Tax=Chanos chanos TaxID=29144 RepID=A0A6J2VMB5_CHACN|nr:abasic site processing protein HMCES [Chanos chanos]
MCGRTACTLAPDEISRASRYRDRAGRRRRPKWKDGDADKYRSSYNKSPQSFSPVLLSHRHFNKDAPADEFVLASMRWGLVPAWFKENDPSKMQYSTSNCRSESLLEKKSYKDPLLKGQRCVILADGFYEWKRQEKGKQPFFIYFPQSQGKVLSQQDTAKEDEKNTSKLLPMEKNLDQDKADSEWGGWRLLTMAGLFDCWTPPGGGEALYSYSIITVDAAPNIQDIHNRMPAVLEGEEEVRRWLDFGEVRSLDAMKLLQPKSTLTFHPVSSFVNNSRNNSPECLLPVDLNSKKAPLPSASSNRMMNWLKTGSPTKRKEPAEDDKHKERSFGKPSPKKQPKPGSVLEQWLLESRSNKKCQTT